ncbi:hypothetical protein F4780DRAFT_665229 [Xylariomycetidae sp. FL0641]|nr:hypothetical protein F4780DRAFT_665229 [Xylariomycetidae sp. FL0641]
MAFISALRRCSLLALAAVLFIFIQSSHATSIPRTRGLPTSADTSLWRQLLDIPAKWSSGKSKKNLGRWLEDHPKAVEGLMQYENQIVVRFDLASSEDERALRKAVDQMLLDVWDFAANYTDIRLPARRLRPLMTILPRTMQSGHRILIPDLARAIAQTYPSDAPIDSALQSLSSGRGITPIYGPSLPQKQGVDDVFFQDYQPYSVINTWMRLLDSMFKGRGLVRMISIGTSYEGRDIPALKVGKQQTEAARGHPHSTRDTILITGGLHAREWIGISTVNYLAWSFIKSIDKDPMVTKILEHFDLVFVPVMNPDGYQYTWEGDRLWRKSRQRTKMLYCLGYDLDHAFGFKWDGAEHQDEPCNDSYGGDQPFQAVEAAQLANWAKNETKNGAKFVGFLDLHSYSQQILYPFAYACRPNPPNFENLQEVGLDLAKAMRLTSGLVYNVGSACESAVAREDDAVKTRIEAGGGAAIDYFYHSLGARFSYQIKLRDTGSYGFLLPPRAIIPTGEEVFHAMKFFGDFLLGNNGHEMATDAQIEVHQDQDSMVYDEDDNESAMELRRRRRKRSCVNCVEE